jgi:hypothetical protein
VYRRLVYLTEASGGGVDAGEAARMRALWDQEEAPQKGKGDSGAPAVPHVPPPRFSNAAMQSTFDSGRMMTASFNYERNLPLKMVDVMLKSGNLRFDRTLKPWQRLVVTQRLRHGFLHNFEAWGCQEWLLKAPRLAVGFQYRETDEFWEIPWDFDLDELSKFVKKTSLTQTNSLLNNL